MNHSDIKLVIDQLNNLEVVHDYDENVTDDAAQMLETLGNQVAKQAEQLNFIVKECDASSTQTTRIIRIKSRAEAALNGDEVTFISVKDKRENKVAHIKQLRHRLAEQAAVIEKLRDALIDCQLATDWTTVHRTAKEALAIPTDSTKVLQDWLDEKFGEPVAYKCYSGTLVYRKESISPSQRTMPITPLFKKPEILK